MIKRFFITIITITTITLSQSCTTAIIDEGTVEELPPLNRTVTYQSDVQNIMFNRCITCHGGSAPQSGLDLSTYQNTRFSAEMGSLIQRMNNATNPMPPNGLVSPELRQIMDKWVTDGFLEN
ncbi:hypothetical protein [uncultured Winogradskyella sp.]|uniref:hypothetical protein n=1 Tax=uncultured Winogradskyella sp. TaxID=395353 RepID=UPI0030DB2ABF|tara:strand:+ start:11413 stop:11778 length:366 start_codon:yes stop_codon:yes gene_type:complete